MTRKLHRSDHRTAFGGKGFRVRAAPRASRKAGASAPHLHSEAYVSFARCQISGASHEQKAANRVFRPLLRLPYPLDGGNAEIRFSTRRVVNHTLVTTLCVVTPRRTLRVHWRRNLLQQSQFHPKGRGASDVVRSHAECGNEDFAVLLVFSQDAFHFGIGTARLSDSVTFALSPVSLELKPWPNPIAL